MIVHKPTLLESKFSVDQMTDFKGFIKEALEALISSHTMRVTQKLAEWNNLYRGMPREKTRSTPWENASNIVVQIVGQHTDTLTARILGSIYELKPLWPIQVLGEYNSGDVTEQKRELLEEFLHQNAIDPEELDFYRVQQLWFSDAIKYGFKVVKAIHEAKFEQQLCDGSELRIPIHVGPKIENVNYEDFLADNNYKTIESCPVKAERLYLTKQDLEERRYTKRFKSSAVDKVLASSPDDTGSTQVEKERNTDTGIAPIAFTGAFARWHIYECWASYFLNGKTFSTVSYFHHATRTYLGGYFNYLPNNKEPYFSARLGYRSSDLYGQGFCELLAHAQEEATAIHNRRNDNATIANLRMFRISPKATRLGGNIKLQPFSILRADKDEIEPLQLGDIYNSTFDEESLLLKEAADRSGTAPAVAGMGSGTINKKGVYSSQGTQALMLDGNRRVNLDTMDMRYAHVKVGKFLLSLYSYFGVPSDKLSKFGTNGKVLSEALNDCKTNKFNVSVQAATSSINRELDRQNDVFLTQVFNRHFSSMAQFLQAILSPQTPPQIKDYFVSVAAASDTLMTKVAKSFGLDNSSSFIPKSSFLELLNTQKTKLSEMKKQLSTSNGVQNGYNQNISGVPSTGTEFSQVEGVQADSGDSSGTEGATNPGASEAEPGGSDAG